MESKARIYITGAAAVLVSGVKLEDWKKADKYAPESLKIVNDKGDPVFRIVVDEGGGTVNEYGICWGSYTSEDGYATVTVLLDDDIEDKKAAVMDIMGSAILDLTEIEKGMFKILEEIREKETEIGSRITVI